MAQVILNIPSEKIQEFLIAMAQFCLTSKIKNTVNLKNKHQPKLIPLNTGLNSQHPYFDKEFFENYIFE